MAPPFIIFTDLDGPICNHRSNYATGDQFDPISAGSQEIRPATAADAASRRRDGVPITV